MDIKTITNELKERYPNAGIQRIDYKEGDSTASFYLNPNNKALAMLEKNAVRPRIAQAATITRTTLDRSFLDLSISKSPSEEDPKDLFSRSMKYYYEDDVYGTAVDVLSNFAAKGFENDIDDENIKAFYDTWCFDVNFKQMIDWIFFDLFRVGMVRTYKIVGKYEAGITYMEPVGNRPSAGSPKQAKSFFKEVAKRAERYRIKQLDMLTKSEKKYKNDKNALEEIAAKKKMWSKGYMPVAYTVLNPLLIELDGSLLFDRAKTMLQPSDELKKMFQKNQSELTEDEKEIIKLLPSEFKAQLTQGGGITLDSLYVGAVDYRKQPYERYPKPRGVKAFDSIEYKRKLREADISTLDGISNYILKVTIGNDNYPVTDQSQLETVAQLFDTPSKSFDVVWNHTLQVEKIISPEIGEILGKEKYEQVNMDITGALGMSRAFFDGAGNDSQAEVNLMVRTVIEEIEYARRQVTKWIYNEYRQIAEAAGFDRFPKVRWDQTVLKDIVLYMATVSQLVDRRMLSYETALEELGFDYQNELGNMQEEMPLVQEGVFGIIGSPWQQAKSQPVQNSPTGTPSAGRPKAQPATPKKQNTDVTKQTKVPNQSPSQQPNPTPSKKAASLGDIIQDMTDDGFDEFIHYIRSYREQKIDN